MDLTKIVSVSGRSGLFKIVSQGKNAVIVESLADQKRFPAFGHEKMSSLEEISVFTTGDDRPLKDVFKTFHEKLEGKAAVDPKSENNILMKFFREMVPDFNQEKVYVSDIRKMISWYNLLIEHNLLDFTEVEGDKPAEPAEKPATEAVKPAEAEESVKPAAKTEKPAAKAGKPAKPVEEHAPGAPKPPEKIVGEAKPEKKTPKKKKQE